MKTKEITEIRADYTDDEGFIHIDVWESNDENAEGRTVAIVCGDTKKVFFLEEQFREDKGVKIAIQEVHDAIDLARMLDGVEENPIEKIDWSELRNQKTTLANLIQGDLNEEDEREVRGLLWTIGELQDYAVNGMNINPKHIYDEDIEDYLEETLNN